ncbi:MAG: hypothetical protein QXL96_00485 [Ignisphaera sp.]
MGTKGGKPISSIEKKQTRIEKKEEKKFVREEKKEARPTIVDPSLIKKVAEDIKNAPFVTTFTLVQRYGIKYSTAKKILRDLASQNIISINLKSRRVIVATPTKGSTK